MKLQTKIPIQKETRNQIEYHSTILLLGSCFSDNIGEKFNYFKFQCLQNPFGILFHPKAIENLVTNAINLKKYTDNDITLQNERWHSLNAHSSLSSNNKEQLLANLNSAISETHKTIHKASHIIITLGTAWVYRFIETDKIVANCHKIPQKKFSKELLTVDEITEILAATVALLKSVNKNINILFTVSPVRHLKDGFIENTKSKSHLITAIHNIIDKRRNIHYFPSYEIMMDELRDYRFYAEDMIHPNNTAINYIWDRFIDTWFTQETLSTLKEIDTIQKGILHKPFNSSSKEHQRFLQNLSAKKDKITIQFPFIKF